MVEILGVTLTSVLVATIAATITGIGVATAFFLNWLELRRKNKVRFAELIIEFNKELNCLELERKTITSSNELVAWIHRYLNKLEEIPHLNLKKNIPDDIPEFFQSWIKRGYHAMVWLETKNLTWTEKKPTETWEHITKWCQKHNIEPDNEPLPHYIQQYCNLKDSEAVVSKTNDSQK
ncbi:MAG: hypothetical protein ACW9W3_03325 [Candidatus Nitrosopumilus sp. bin_68KS]